MTYLVLIVIANPAGWLQQGVKRSPTRGTRTGSIRSHTRRGQLRNPPTNYASLPMTTLFSSSLRTQGWFVGKAVKQSPAREAAATATSMRYIYWRGWLRSPCTSIASLPMTYFCFFVIANLVGWPQRCVKRSPTRGTRTGSIPSHTRGGQLRNRPTNYASLAVTIIFAVFVIPTPSIFAKMVPLAMTIRFYFVISTPSIFTKMCLCAMTILFFIKSS